MEYEFIYGERHGKKIMRNCGRDESVAFVDFMSNLLQKGIISVQEIRTALNEAQDETIQDIDHALESYSNKLIKRIK